MTQAFNLGALYDARTGGDGIALIDVLDWENPRIYSHREIDDAANALARGLLKGTSGSGLYLIVWIGYAETWPVRSGWNSQVRCII